MERAEGREERTGRAVIGWRSPCVQPRRTCPAPRRPTPRSTARSTLLLADETEAALRWSAAVVERDPLDAERAGHHLPAARADGPHRGGGRGLRARRAARDRRGQPAARGGRHRRSSRAGGRRERAPRSASRPRSARGRRAARRPRTPPAAAPATSRASSRSAPSSRAPRSPPRRRRSSTPPRARLRRRPTGSESCSRRRCRSSARCRKEALRELVGAFEMITVPAGHVVIEEGEEGSEAYIVARGELEVLGARRTTRAAAHRCSRGWSAGRSSARWRSSRARRARRASSRRGRPSCSSPSATRSRRSPRGAPRWASSWPRTAAGAWWRTSARTSPVLVAVPPQERAMLVERFETRIFEKGEKLVTQGEEAQGLHLVASGEVAVVAHEGGESVVLATLSAGRDRGRGRARAPPQGERRRHRGAPDGDAVSAAGGVPVARPGPPGASSTGST